MNEIPISIYDDLKADILNAIPEPWRLIDTLIFIRGLTSAILKADAAIAALEAERDSHIKELVCQWCGWPKHAHNSDFTCGINTKGYGHCWMAETEDNLTIM